MIPESIKQQLQSAFIVAETTRRIPIIQHLNRRNAPMNELQTAQWILDNTYDATPGDDRYQWSELVEELS